MRVTLRLLPVLALLLLLSLGAMGCESKTECEKFAEAYCDENLHSEGDYEPCRLEVWADCLNGRAPE